MQNISLQFQKNVIYCMKSEGEMDRKQLLLEKLESAEGFVSGNELADCLGVTRASVWKYIKALKSDGYQVEAITNRGYRLSPLNDVITVGGVKKALGEDAEKFEIEVLQSCSSTNQVLKSKAESLPQWHVLIAESQSAGRGRNGRKFFSPNGSGLYMSVLLRPKLQVSEATLITTAAAVAVCRAIQELAGVRAEIKWVNDVFLRGKKVCGILTEANLDMESGMLNYAVLGIGINITEPKGGFSKEIVGIAGSVFDGGEYQLRCRFAAEVLKKLYAILEELPCRDFISEYRSLNFVVGRNVQVLRNDTSETAFAEGIDEECRLVVRFPDGRVEKLSSGEVSVKPMGG